MCPCPREVLLAIPLALLAACAGPERSSSEPQSLLTRDLPRLRRGGARLRPLRLVAENGAVAYGEWWDKELGTTCSFLPTADLKVRCVPAGPTTTHFEDAECSQPLFLEEQLCARSPYGRWHDPRLPGRLRVARLDAPRVVARPYAYDAATRTCAPAAALAGRRFSAARESLAPERLVAKTNKVPASTSDHLTAINQQADDGSHWRLGLFDTRVGAACESRRATDGETRCLPGTGVIYASRTDPSCSKEIRGVASEHATASGFFEARPVAGAADGPVQFAIRAVSATRYAGPLFASIYGRCERQLAGLTDAVYFEDANDSEQIPPERFARIERSVTLPGRLAQTWEIAESGLVHPETERFLDRDLKGETCRFVRSSDGRWRCLPGLTYSMNYEDPACTRRLVMPLEFPNLSKTKHPDWGLARLEDSCGDVRAVFALGPRATESYERLHDGSCVPSKPSARAHRRGEEIPPGRFAVAEEIQD